MNTFIKGSGKPLVMIPGWRTDIERLKPLLEVLADHFKVYCLDLPGTGKTPPLPKNDLPNYAKFVTRWIKSLNLKDYILGGISMGCPIAVLTLKNLNPKSALFLLPMYDKNSLKIRKTVLKSIEIGTRVLKNRPFSNIGNKIYQSDRAMGLITSFEKDKALKDPKNRKYHIDSFKKFPFGPSMETIYYTLKQKIPTKKYDIPVIFIMSRDDPLVDFKYTTKSFKNIFPNLVVEELREPIHAPRTIIKKEFIEKRFGKEIMNAKKLLT